MKKIIFYLISAAIVGLFACKKEGIPVYSGENGVYFSNKTDSSKITFAYDFSGVKDSTISVRVNALGPVADVDRAFRVNFIDSLTTAKRGIHYSMDTTQFVINAGKTFTNLKFKLLRLPEMAKKSFVITLLLEPNENFTTNYSWEWVDLDKDSTRQLLRYTIVFDDIFAQPRTWLPSVFGTFSQKKLYAISEFFDIAISRWNSTGADRIPAILIGSYGKVFQNYLNKEKANGNTIYDEDGTEMVMGPSSQ